MTTRRLTPLAPHGPRASNWRLAILLVIFFTYWACLLAPATKVLPSAGPAAYHALVLLALVTMLTVVNFHLRLLERAGAVFGQRKVPTSAWRKMVDDAASHGGLIWAVLMLATWFQVLISDSGIAPLAGPALVSLLACFSVLPHFALTPRWSSGWRWVNWLLLGGLVVAFASGRVGQLFAGFYALPSAMLALLTLALPLTGLLLARRWRASAPTYRWTEPATVHPLRRRAQIELGRYTMLPLKEAPDALAGFEKSEPGLKVVQLVAGIVSLNLMAFLPLSVARGEAPATLLTLVVLLAWSIGQSGMLVARDAHWRSLLAPGGLRRGSVATSVWTTTLALQLGGSLLIAFAVAIAARVGFGCSWESLIAGAYKYGYVVLNLPLLVACAMLVRLLPGWLRALGGLALVIVFTSPALINAAWFKHVADPGIALYPALYLGLLTAATLALLAFANRRWEPGMLARGARA